MPLTMKVQPIDGTGAEQDSAPVKPVVKSRLKRLFRISVSEPTPTPVEVFEPSSVCLAKMVANFIEENNNNERHASRNRCNCFNGNGSDGSDGEADAVSASDVCDFLKSLVVCASVNERNVLADTARVVAEKNKACKRKDELRKLVVEGLMAGGYDAAICKSKWEKSPSFPAGEYEYVDVVVGGERLIIDIDFRSEFVLARSTKTYKSILQTLPHIFVGKSDRLSKVICILSEAAKQSLKKKGMHIPPWRKADYVQAKWLSPPNRVAANSVSAIPTPNPMTGVGSLNISNGPSPNNPATPPPSLLTPVAPLSCFNGPSSNESATPTLNPLSPVVSNSPSPTKSSPATTLAEGHQADETEASSVSPKSETVFDMSDGSEEEDTKVEEAKLKKEQAAPKKSLKIIAGLASLMEHKP